MRKLVAAAQKLTLHRKRKMSYPPPLSDDQLEVVAADIKDWQITHGSLLKIISSEEDNTVLTHPVGATLFPTLFPAELFNDALALRRLYNKLYTAVAEDEEWLNQTLKPLIEVDFLASNLWGIYEEVKREGQIQDVALGIFRSDYMLHQPSPSQEPQLKQVEFNTISCAGGIHSSRISDMHRHLHRTDAYQPLSTESNFIDMDSCTLPTNRTLSRISAGLYAAHNAYGSSKSSPTIQKCILFIVQDRNFNIADERPIEYALWQQCIPTYRLLFGQDVLDHTSLTPSRELLYHPPNRGTPMEVSSVYYRAGFEEHEYQGNNGVGRAARLKLERSRAIKCPSLLSHLSTFKKVQQELAMPGVLERFLHPDEASIISKTFAPMYPLNDSGAGLKARKMLELDPKASANYILKPSREGGGHNIYGEQIPIFLARTPKEEWHQYILMEKIVPPVLRNFLMSPRALYEGPVISELGIFGICLWRRKSGEESKGRREAGIMEDYEGAWSFKTKDASVDEMSVVKGYGCFDSPALVSREVFESCVGKE
jgi:glutathione synthetase